MAGTLEVAHAAGVAELAADFEGQRERLYTQYEEPPFAPETGPGPEELGREVERYLEANAGKPRVVRKAGVCHIVLSRARICVDPRDWFVDKIAHGGIVRGLQRQWLGDAREGVLKDEARWASRAFELGVVRAGIDLGHISPGWDTLLSKGLTGIVDDARRRRDELGPDATDGRAAFYEAVETACSGAIVLAGRFADLAESMVDAHPEQASRLRAVASVCRQVPAGPARTLQEALQSMWFMHELAELEGEHIRSMGHFDRMLGPYYEADLAAGRITRTHAKELLKFLWVRNFARTRGRSVSGKNFLFGGQDAHGEPVANEFTFMALEAFEELDLPDPKLSIRFSPGSPAGLYERTADMIRRGKGSFVLLNDGPGVESLVRRGKTVEDARTYLPIGCYEPAVDGKEAACTMNLIVNLAKGVELALGNGVDPVSGERVGPETGDPRAFRDFDELFDAYAKQMDFVLERATDNIKAHERAWPAVNPSPFLASTIDDCLARGKDIGEGGARYNAVGCVGVALANVADSLVAVKRAVFTDGDETRYTMDEVLEAVASDFDGRERMRQYLLNVAPKWGTGDAEADEVAKRVADHFCGKIHSFTNARGGPFQASLFSFTFQWQYGKKTGALPDGRRAGTPLAPGVGAMPGRERRGVTALVNSVGKLDFAEMPNGSVLDVTLHPSAVRGPEGLAALVTLVKTFFAKGGFGLQFNVVDAETLKAAQERPEEHASLQVRVTGYSAFFTKLSKYEQDHFISRQAHGA